MGAPASMLPLGRSELCLPSSGSPRVLPLPFSTLKILSKSVTGLAFVAASSRPSGVPWGSMVLWLFCWAAAAPGRSVLSLGTLFSSAASRAGSAGAGGAAESSERPGTAQGKGSRDRGRAGGEAPLAAPPPLRPPAPGPGPAGEMVLSAGSAPALGCPGMEGKGSYP